MFYSLLASLQLLMPGFIASLDFCRSDGTSGMYPQTTISELLRLFQTIIFVTRTRQVRRGVWQ